jgi:hypothetical protein
MPLTDIHLWEMSTAASLIPVDYSALLKRDTGNLQRDFNPNHSRLFTRSKKNGAECPSRGHAGLQALLVKAYAYPPALWA